MNKNSVILFIIILFASLLRLYRLSDVPIALNPDETALGYTAYSLLTTLKDEHGQILPLTFKSFGDWKLISYPLLSTIPVALFGLNEFSTRLISALSGIISVVLIYFLSKKLSKNIKVAQIAAFFAALTPWSLYFSRIAFEGSPAITLILGGVLLLFNSNDHKSKKQSRLYIAFCILGFALFFYHPFLVFIPFFVILLTLFSQQIFPNIVASKVKYASLVFWAFFIIALISVIFPSVDKLKTLTVFNDQEMIHQRVELVRTDNSEESLFTKKAFHNRYVASFYQVGQNYISSLSPSFLFDNGGQKLMYSLGNFGQLYLIDSLFLIAGFGTLLWKRQKISVTLLLIWLVAGFLPSSVTTDAPSASRLFLNYPAFILIAANGAYFLLSYFWQNIRFRFIALVLIALFVGNVLFFLEGYFVHMNFQRARYLHYGYKQVAEIAMKYPDYSIVMRGPENFPYVSFLFYEKYNPQKYIDSVEYYPSTKDGFELVKSFGRYQFPQDIKIKEYKSKTIYIDFSDEENIFENLFIDKVETKSVNLPSGESIFTYAIID